MSARPFACAECGKCHITHVFIVAPELTRAAVYADAKVDGTIMLLERHGSRVARGVP